MFVLDTLTHRLKRGCETMAYPEGPPPPLPDRHGGSLRLDSSKCAEHCDTCVGACPTQAIAPRKGRGATLDLGRCLFCSACVEACPSGSITHTGDHRMAARTRADLVIGEEGREELRLATALDERLRRLLGRSLKLRVVSAGGCGAEEADLNVLGTIGWDIGRFGIQFVASPRHADGLVVAGPVSRNMELALRKTWEAIPEPKIAIAVGSSAVSGAPFAGNPQVLGGLASVVPVDLYIPGWPPHPLTILDGLLRILGRLDERSLARPA